MQPDGFRHIPISVHDKDAPIADLVPPPELHDAFVALAASLTSKVSVEGSAYAAALLKASIQAISDYNRPENKVSRDEAFLLSSCLPLPVALSPY